MSSDSGILSRFVLSRIQERSGVLEIPGRRDPAGDCCRNLSRRLGDLGEKDFKGESCAGVRVMFRKRVVVGSLVSILRAWRGIGIINWIQFTRT